MCPQTRLVWDCGSRRLLVSGSKYLETGRKMELTLKGLLDTASGQHRLRGHIRRNFYTHVPLLQRLLANAAQRQAGAWVDEPQLNPDAFLPGGPGMLAGEASLAGATCYHARLVCSTESGCSPCCLSRTHTLQRTSSTGPAAYHARA